jgi:hypothetical protein
MASRSKEELKTIREGFLGRKRPMPEVQEQSEDNSPGPKYNSFGAEIEDEEAELPEDAPIKDKITRSLLKILRRRGMPEK